MTSPSNLPIVSCAAATSRPHSVLESTIETASRWRKAYHATLQEDVFITYQADSNLAGEHFTREEFAALDARWPDILDQTMDDYQDIFWGAEIRRCRDLLVQPRPVILTCNVLDASKRAVRAPVGKSFALCKLYSVREHQNDAVRCYAFEMEAYRMKVTPTGISYATTTDMAYFLVTKEMMDATYPGWFSRYTIAMELGYKACDAQDYMFQPSCERHEVLPNEDLVP